MKSIYGGSWSWDRRAILVKYNGHVYAASMNGMPHEDDTISDNDFDGHFCIHFTGSKTHGTQRVDEDHQSCVQTALYVYLLNKASEAHRAARFPLRKQGGHFFARGQASPPAAFTGGRG